MERKSMIYEGKAKKVYSTDDDNYVIISYKDDATAFNGEKKGTIQSKGIMNNKITSIIFEELARNNIKTHFEKKLSDREQLCKKVEIIPLEVIVRNVAAGSFSNRYGVPEGKVLNNPVFEICYKDDLLGDPFINDSAALALDFATEEQLSQIYSITKKVNNSLINFFNKINITLVDFKLEFGKFGQEVILADEISPDTCRFWDKNTNEKLDKDRFRRDLGKIEDAYIEILSRLESIDN